MSSTSTHKDQFYLKLKTIKKSDNQLISRKHLELWKNIPLTSINKISAAMMMPMMLLLQGLKRE